MDTEEQRAFALQALHLVRQALGTAIADRVLQVVLWIDQNETLADRLDRSIADLEHPELKVPFLAAEISATLRRTAAVLDIANCSGDLQDTLWASAHETLFDYIQHAIEWLQQPEPAEA